MMEIYTYGYTLMNAWTEKHHQLSSLQNRLRNESMHLIGDKFHRSRRSW